MAYKMMMNKEKFLKTEFGAELENCINVWDNALEERSRCAIGNAKGDSKGLGYSYWNNTCTWCQAQWEIYQLALRQFYSLEYHFTRTSEYYGVVTADEKDWLIKFERENVRAREILERVKETFRGLDPEEQTIDILNNFPSLALKPEEITKDFIKFMESEPSIQVTYRLGKLPYFVITSKACLNRENEAMFAAEAAMM